MAEISQTFLLIATFDIALISVAIANYAVSASYLGRETRLTRRRLDKRKDQLDLKVKELQAKGKIEIEDLKKEIKEAEKERNRLGTRILFLSWGGAVIIPCLLFIISLLNAIWGMHLDTDSSPQLFTSSFFLACGFAFLLIVIGTIDSAARNIPLPEFEIFFGNKLKTMKLERNIKTGIVVCVKNKGEDMGENVDVFLHFPPEFQIQKNPFYEVEKQLDVGADFPNYNAVIIRPAILHADIISGGEVFVTTPNENGTYKIPVSIYESKTGLTKDKLEIEITD